MGAWAMREDATARRSLSTGCQTNKRGSWPPSSNLASAREGKKRRKIGWFRSVMDSASHPEMGTFSRLDLFW